MQLRRIPSMCRPAHRALKAQTQTLPMPGQGKPATGLMRRMPSREHRKEVNSCSLAKMPQLCATHTTQEKKNQPNPHHFSASGFVYLTFFDFFFPASMTRWLFDRQWKEMDALKNS
eukprot:EG_transcript_44643